MPERTLTIKAVGQDLTGGLVSGITGNFGLFGTAMGVVSTVASTLVTAVSSGIGVISGLGLSALSTSIQVETAFAGILKTTEGLTSDFGVLNTAGEELKDAFLDLSTAIPVDIVDLMKIGEIGGQMGVAKDDLVGFTDTVARLTETTNLMGEEAALAFGQLGAIVGATDFGPMGASVVALGNNFATTESQVVRFSQYIAGAGTAAGMAVADILGIATAFSAVGVRAERGGTAVQKVIDAIQTAVESSLGEEGATAALNTFAHTAGMTADEFIQAWDTDPAAAFTAFVEGLGAEGINAAAVMQELELGDQRLIQAFRSVSSAGTLMSDAIDLSNEAFEENAALVYESNQRFATTESRITLLKNILKDLTTQLGDEVNPKFNDFLKTITPIVTEIGDQLLPIIVAGLQPALEAIVLVLDSVALGLTTFNEGLSAGLDPVEAFKEALLAMLPESLHEEIEWVFDFLGVKLPEALQTFADFIVEKVIPAGEGLWNFFIDDLLPILTDFWTYITENVVPALVTFGDTFLTTLADTNDPIAAFTEALRTLIPEEMKDDFDGIVSWLQTELPDAIAAAKTWWTEEFVPTMKEDVVPAITDVVSGLLNLINSIRGISEGDPESEEALATLIQTMLTKAVNILEENEGTLADAFSNLIAAAIDIVIGGVALYAQSLYVGGIRGIVLGSTEKLAGEEDTLASNLGERFGAWVRISIEKFAGLVESLVSPLWQALKDLFGKVLDDTTNSDSLILQLSGFWLDVTSGFLEGIIGEENLKDFADGIKAWFTGGIDKFKTSHTVTTVTEFLSAWDTLSADFRALFFSDERKQAWAEQLKLGLAASWAAAMTYIDIDAWTVLFKDVFLGEAGIFSKLKASLLGEVETFKGIGKDLLDGLLAGLKEKAAVITEWWDNSFVKTIIDKVKGGFGESSPSKVFLDIGVNLMEGFLEGISMEEAKVLKKVGNFVENIVTAFAAIGEMTGGFTQELPDIHSYLAGYKEAMIAIVDVVEDINDFFGYDKIKKLQNTAKRFKVIWAAVVQDFSAIKIIEMPDLTLWQNQAIHVGRAVVAVLNDLEFTFGYEGVTDAAALAEHADVILGTIGDFITAVNTMATYTEMGSLKGAATNLANRTKELLVALSNAAQDMEVAATEHAANIYSFATEILAPVEAAMTAIAAVFGYEPTEGLAASAENFALDVIALAGALQDAAKDLDLTAYEAAAAIYATVSGIVGVVQPGIAALTALFSYVHLQNLPSKATTFATDLLAVANNLEISSRNMDLDALKAAELIYAAVQGIVGVIEPGVTNLQAVLEYTSSMFLVKHANDFAWDLVTVANVFKTVSETVDVTGLTSAEAIYTTIGSIVGVAKDSIDALLAMLGYTTEENLKNRAEEWLMDLQFALYSLVTASLDAEHCRPQISALADDLINFSFMLQHALAVFGSLETAGRQNIFAGLLHSFRTGSEILFQEMSHFFAQITQLIVESGFDWSNAGYDAGMRLTQAILDGIIDGRDSGSSDFEEATRRVPTTEGAGEPSTGPGLHVTINTTADPEDIVQAMVDGGTAALMGSGVWGA